MASVTIRNLDQALKQRLRERAARHGRSMEEEIRQILSRSSADALADAPTERGGPPRRAPAAGTRTPTASANVGTGALAGRRVVLVITGGIAAYKALDLIRRLKERGAVTRVVMTRAAQEFVTPLAVSALAGERAYADLFDAQTELDVGHIRIARDADAIIVCPCSADFLAKMALGLADDLASAVLLATDKPALIAPAMNPRMWGHAATQRNLARVLDDGVRVIGPNAGEMAESNESGVGRMAEPVEIADAVVDMLGGNRARPLAGKRVVITAGPTHEPIDPVRYIANRSSGKQGFAIARAAADAGAKVTLVAGPVALADPPGVDVVRVESARDMLAAVERALPADIAIFAAAVADWRAAKDHAHKIKKGAGRSPQLALIENPDILATVAQRAKERPRLVIGFAAETENVLGYGKAKLKSKGCDWMLANDVSAESGVMGGDRNTIHLITRKGVENWPEQSKDDVAHLLMTRIATELHGT